MNEELPYIRKRRKVLLIVEGEHEKNNLFWLLFESFPEIDIKYDDVWIYGTNIYILYQEIVKEYGESWADNGDDIDLPFVISKNHPALTNNQKERKDDYSDIFLVFDYERQDPKFDERKIMEMQTQFNDSTDNGKLFINYPMVESYRHFVKLPDTLFKTRDFELISAKGSTYKSLVKRVSCVEKILNFPDKIKYVLEESLSITDCTTQKHILNCILNLCDETHLLENIKSAFYGYEDNPEYLRVCYMLKADIERMQFMHIDISYWKYVREIFKQIIVANACKANNIQNGRYSISKTEYSELDLAEILNKQNLKSAGKFTRCIWVLNTSVFLIADYNYSLVE